MPDGDNIPMDHIAIPINVDESINSNDSANENTDDNDSNNSNPPGAGRGGIEVEVERQQEKELGAAEKKEDGQFDDAPDNHEKECGQYGKVLNVAIIDAHSNQEHVRVDVTFENKESEMEK
ncbi:hypothetical protein HJC23_003143 [Cyclotella cryptica]|uniref:Uncharacterized protein n=1 Tax=Cyclotella cryptica TaxID=29204 RepID=A0ABD3P5N4_9STRA